MSNFKVPIHTNGRVTLLTAGKYCDRDIDVTVGVADGDGTEVYEQGVADGRQAEYDRFWDAYQQNGSRSSYAYAFAGGGWTDETFDPKYPIVVKGSAHTMFRESNIGKALDIDFSGCTSLQYAFYDTEITAIAEVNASAMANAGLLTHAFAHSRLTTLGKLVLNTTTGTFTNTFQNANYLEHITIEGEINRNGLDFHWSPLTHDSLMSILHALADYSADTTGTVWKITLGDTNLAKLTTDELAIMDSKGWQYA